VILGISPDSVDSHKKFIQKKGIGVELLSDPERSVLEAYGAWGLKKMYGKEYEGVIRSSILIDPKGIVRRAWPKAQAKGHAMEMLEALKGLKD
jgi:peroxiredoxin Q/BCP